MTRCPRRARPNCLRGGCGGQGQCALDGFLVVDGPVELEDQRCGDADFLPVGDVDDDVELLLGIEGGERSLDRHRQSVLPDGTALPGVGGAVAEHLVDGEGGAIVGERAGDRLAAGVDQFDVGVQRAARRLDLDLGGRIGRGGIVECRCVGDLDGRLLRLLGGGGVVGSSTGGGHEARGGDACRRENGASAGCRLRVHVGTRVPRPADERLSACCDSVKTAMPATPATHADGRAHRRGRRSRGPPRVRRRGPTNAGPCMRTRRRGLRE